jgi:enediyne biosynthesis protein E4
MCLQEPPHRRPSMLGRVYLRLAVIGGCAAVLAVVGLSYLLLELGLPGQERQPSGKASAPAPGDVESSAEHTRIRFTDVTQQAGIHFMHDAGARGDKWYPETIGAGGGFFDYDGDGRPDILLINGRYWPHWRQASEPTMRLYRNLGDGTFAEVTEAAGLNIPLYGMGLVAADYDNDGDQDLMVTGYLRNLFFINNGDGTFTEATAAVGIQGGKWSTAAAFVDYDRDGFLDLVVGHYVNWDADKERGLDCTYGTPSKDYCAVRYFQGQGLTLYRNLGDGRFAEVTRAAGIEAKDAKVLGITIVDFNDDGWPDLFVANDTTPSLFFKNRGDGTFEEVGMRSGIVVDEGGMAFAGMGVDAAYVKNDGQLCIAIGNFAGEPTTLHCQVKRGEAYHPELFVEQSHWAGIGKVTLRFVTFGLFFFDVDLDGFADLFMVNGHVFNEEKLRNIPYAQRPQLFRNLGSGKFQEIVPAEGTALAREIIGRGAAYADYDGDGDLDILLTTNQGPAYLLRNETARHSHFVRVKTQGTRSNRDGIGAKVRVYTAKGLLQTMVRTGSTYLSQSELTLTFGLGNSPSIGKIQISWPSGIVDEVADVGIDTLLLVREGEGAR